MAMYMSMREAETGQLVFSGARWLPGTIWNDIVREDGQEMHPEYDEMEFCKDYIIDVQDIPRIIKYYENLIDGKSDNGFNMVRYIKHTLIPSLKHQLKNQVDNNKKYIVRWD